MIRLEMIQPFPGGWKKDPYDPRDYLHPMRAPAAVPNAYIIEEKYLPEVRDQGEVGSCVGFGIGGNATGTAKQQAVYTEWKSPTWLYNGARFIEGSLNEDAGCYPKDALDWALKKGFLLERWWPYDPDEVDTTSPPSRLDPEAAKWPMKAYYRVTGDAEGICSALSEGRFVSIGGPWFYKWMDCPSGDLPVVKKSDWIAGGHETLLYGYDKSVNRFYGQNSWGKDFGKQGRFTMPFSALGVFKQTGGYDAHYIEVDWRNPVPPTPPGPGPQPAKARVRLQESEDQGNTWKTLFETDV